MNEYYKALINPKGKFGFWGIALMVFLGISLLVFPQLFLEESEPGQRSGEILEPASGMSHPLTALEQEIARQVVIILGQVEGAGTVAVSVSLEAGIEQEYAQNSTEDKSVIEEKDSGGGMRLTTTENKKVDTVFAQGGGKPLVVKELGPAIKGVLVVAEGAREGEVKFRLTRAVQTMLNVPAHRVLVLPKESR